MAKNKKTGNAEPRLLSKGVYIALLIFAILLALLFGLPFLTVAPVVGVIILAIVALLLVKAIKGIKRHKKPKEAPIQPIKHTTPISPTSVKTPPQAPTNEEHHKVAGLSFHEDALEELWCENEDYSCGKRELVDMGMTGERIWKYEFFCSGAELIPEPDNEIDPNAIKVVVKGQHIGYIKKGSCAHIRKLLNSDSIKSIDIEIGGGPYKYIEEDYDEDGNDVYTLEKGTTQYFAELTITKK